MRPPATASLLVLVLLVSALPAGSALLGTGDSVFAFSSAAYQAEVRWREEPRLDGVVFTATVQHAGRSGALQQHVTVGDVFGLAESDLPLVVDGDVGTSSSGDPVLTLRVSTLAPGAAQVLELGGEATLTFTPDAILHGYEFHAPNAAFTPSFVSTTTMQWSAPFTTVGSARAEGDVTYDDGSSLDAMGAWEAHGTYGVFQHDASGIVGHARLLQGDLVNYLNDGSFRVTPTTSTVRTAFTPFLDAPSAGLAQGLRVEDAIVLGASAPAPAAFADRLGDLRDALMALGFDLIDPADVDVPPPTGFIPHVLVGVPDSGINPYHEVYYRPNLTAHPCTYVEDFPCSIPALPLSVGVYDSWEEAYAADAAVWDAMEYRKWYWIPKTAFVAVMCEGSTNAAGTLDGENKCLIDDSSDHGTGTTSSILTENPNALIAFKEGNSATTVFEDGTLPIDVLSYSWGAAVPLALPGVISTPADYGPFYVAASGNEGAFPVVLDSPKASQAVINVGAADGRTRSEPGYSGWKTADVVSQYCRPGAATRSITGVTHSYCGTSFSAPTVAGVLSKVILDVRRESGYTGSIVDGMVDPILGVSKWDVRDALNRTATYEPSSRFPAQGGTVPVPAQAPWYQWGWGYVDATVADAMTRCVLDDACAEKDAGAKAYMGALWAFRGAYGGWTAFDAYDCQRGDRAACDRLPPG